MDEMMVRVMRNSLEERLAYVRGAISATPIDQYAMYTRLLNEECYIKHLIAYFLSGSEARAEIQARLLEESA